MIQIKKIIKPILNVWRKEINRWIALYLNKEKYRKSKISKTEYELRKIFLTEGRESSGSFYQSYPHLHINGRRDTLCRFKVYGMDKTLNKKMEVLDIGSNLDFFSAYISGYVKHVDAVEKADYMVKIANKLIRNEKIRNVEIHKIDFAKFNPNKKYDLIISCAVHDFEGKNKSRVEMNFQEYLNSLAPHLRDKGLVLLESHGIHYNKGEHDIEKRVRENKNFRIKSQGWIDDHNGMLRQFFWLEKQKTN